MMQGVSIDKKPYKLQIIKQEICFYYELLLTVSYNWA